MSILPSVITPFWLLAFLPAFFALVVVYLRSKQGQERLVGSTFLLERIARKTIHRTRFLPPLRFFLECALAFLLCLALAGPYWTSGSQHILLLLDDSLSTSAIIDESVLGARTSVFDKLLGRANLVASEAGFGSSFTLVTGSFCEKPLLERASLGELEGALTKLRPKHSQARIERCLEKLLRTQEYDQVHILSDRSLPGNSHADLGENIRVHTESLPESQRENIALRAFSFSPKARTLTVSLQYFSNEQVSSNASSPLDGTKLVIQGIRLTGSGEIIAEELHTRDVNLSPGSSKDFSFQASEAFSLYYAYLENKAISHNRIPLDDQAFVVTRKDSGFVRIVSEKDTRRLGLASGGGKDLPFQFLVQRPEEYEKEKNARQGILSIFDVYVPKSLPAEPVLLVAPGNKNPLLPVGALLKNPGISFAQTAHPITKYLRIDQFHIPSARALSPESWAQDIFRSDGALLLYAGETGGRRLAVSGFEIFPYGGKQALQRSLLTLNLLQWLTSSHNQTSRKPNEIASQDGFFIRKAKTSFERLPMPSGAPFEEPGIYTDYTDAEGRNIAIHAFYNSESGFLEADLSFSSAQTPVVKDPPSSPFFLRFLLAACILLYVLYWITKPFLVLLRGART